MLNLVRTHDLNKIMVQCNLGAHPDSYQDMNKVTPLVASCAGFKSYNDLGQNIESKWLETIKILLQKGANPNQKASNIGTPLTATILRTSHGSMTLPYEIIKLLLSYGASVNEDPFTLHYATTNISPDPNIVKILLQYGVHQTNKKCGKTPLELIKRQREAACYKNDKNLIAIQYMLENGWGAYERKCQTESKQKQTRLEEITKQEQTILTEMTKQVEIDIHQKKQKELAKQDQARQTEIAKQAELAKQAEIARQQKQDEQTKLTKQAEIAKQHEQAKQQEEIKQNDIIQHVRQNDINARINNMMEYIKNLSECVKMMQSKIDIYEKERREQQLTGD